MPQPVRNDPNANPGSKKAVLYSNTVAFDSDRHRDHANAGGENYTLP